jgi:uncharacterized protein
MTPDERNMLADLANKLAQTAPPQRDAEAEEFIRTNIGNRPDALYMMTQTVLIQNLALQRAQQQIQELQQRAAQPAPVASGSSFLGQSAPPPRPQYGGSGYAGAPYSAPPPPQYAAPSAGAPSPGGGMSGFLRGAAQTAAGVAAGTLAVQGIESLFSSHSGFGGFGGGAPTGETIIENNYYDDPRGSEHAQQFADVGNTSDASQSEDDTQVDDAQLQDADYDTSGDDSGFDDSGDSYA